MHSILMESRGGVLPRVWWSDLALLYSYRRSSSWNCVSSTKIRLTYGCTLNISICGLYTSWWLPSLDGSLLLPLLQLRVRVYCVHNSVGPVTLTWQWPRAHLGWKILPTWMDHCSDTAPPVARIATSTSYARNSMAIVALSQIKWNRNRSIGELGPMELYWESFTVALNKGLWVPIW